MLVNVVILLVGFALLVKGADAFVDGSSGIARLLRVPSVVIGLTIVAMGTSLPEASVSVTAGLAGSNGLGLGNVIGSNLFNLLVVAGGCALILAFGIERQLIVRDFPVCVGASALLVLFLLDGVLQRWEGLVLLACMVLYMIWTVCPAMKERTEEHAGVKPSVAKCLLFVVVGVVAIIWGGDLVVDSASAIAAAMGLSETLIGLTIVAVGTSLPELATSIVAARKGESGLALGNAIGSSTFNILFILGASSALTANESSAEVFTDAVVLLVVTAVMCLWCWLQGRMSRLMGGIGILVYVGYIVYAILR